MTLFRTTSLGLHHFVMITMLFIRAKSRMDSLGKSNIPSTEDHGGGVHGADDVDDC